jgi:hypothetical protein
MADALAKIRTEHLLNMSRGCYCYGNLFGVKLSLVMYRKFEKTSCCLLR